MATQQGLPSSQVRLDIGSIWCKKIEFAKTLENMALTLTRDWLIKWCLHPLQIISVILRCWWRSLQFKKKIQKFQEILLYFDKGLTHFKLHYVLYMYPLIDKINFLLILRCLTDELWISVHLLMTAVTMGPFWPLLSCVLGWWINSSKIV